MSATQYTLTPDARIFVDNEQQRLVVIPIAECGHISLVWVIQNLSGGDIAPVTRSVITAVLQQMTTDDFLALGV